MDNSDTNVFDNNEKLNILLKKAFGFACTSENKEWYEENSVTYNNYLTGEYLFIDSIPQYPDFDNNGIIKSATQIGLNSNDFINYSDNSNNKSNCSIVDDSTGTIRRFQNLVLEQSPGLSNNDFGASWLKKDLSNNNLLSDSIQFNYKEYDNSGILYQPYLYNLYTQLSVNSREPDLPFGEKGGNWFFDIKTGIVFFSDFINFSNGIQNDSKFQISNDNRPVLTYYKYIGRKGVNIINSQISTLQEQINILDNSFNLINNSQDISLDIFNQVLYDLSLLSYEFNEFKNNNLSDYYLNQIESLTQQNILLKSDINFNRSLIENNSIDNQIIKKKINNLDKNIDYISEILNDICNNSYNIDNNLLINIINDISNSLLELTTNVNNENILLKGDILISNSNLDYNSTRIELLEENIENINNKYLELKNKFNGFLDSSNTNVDSSNIVFFDSEIISNLYDENLLFKSDLMVLNCDKNYYQEKLNNVENLINNINLSINNLYNRTNNYNIHNLHLFYKNLVLRDNNKINKLKLDYISTYKNGYYNNLFCIDDMISFNKLDKLLENSYIFIEIYCSCFIKNISNNLNNITLDMSINNLENNNYCLTNINIGNSNLNNKNEYVLLGPITYKLTNNINDNKSIYYKNNYNFYISSIGNCDIYDIKVIIKFLNYN